MHSRTTSQEQGRWLSVKEWVEEQRGEHLEQPSRRNAVAGMKKRYAICLADAFWERFEGREACKRCQSLEIGCYRRADGVDPTASGCWACRDSRTMCSPLQLAEWGDRIATHPPSDREAFLKPVPTDSASDQYPSLTFLAKYDFVSTSAPPIATTPVSVGIRNPSVNSTGTVLPSFGSRGEAASLATVHDRARVAASDKKGANCFLYEEDGVPQGTRNSSTIDRMPAPGETPLLLAMPKPSLPLQAHGLEEVASFTKNGKRPRGWAFSDYSVSSTTPIEPDNGWTTHWNEPSAIWAPSTTDQALPSDRLDYDWSHLPPADTHPYSSPPDTPCYSFATLGHFRDSNDEYITSGSALGSRLAPPVDGGRGQGTRALRSCSND